mmetsp:Transcript_27239/g.79758  ORF Transcript_27239/g.79758 Transcript_27239/m.79758 type:complete len:479 (+) Transcript_27239:31-1467(+)
MYILSSLLCALVASPPEACKALRGFYDAIGAKDKSPSFADTSSTCCAFLDVRCTQPDGSPSPPLGQKEGWKAGATLTKIKFRGGTELGGSGTLPGALLLPLAGTLEYLDLGKEGDRSFSGTLPAELAQLTALQKLSLTTGKFSGTIPHQLGRLPALEKVTLLSKRLSGTVPGELCHRSDGSLRKLYLDDNVKLSGTLPPECFLLPTLEEISAKKTRISGTLPSKITAPLRLLILEEVSLSGSVPEELCKGEKLEELVLRRANRVSGTLPTECLSHDTITKIDLKRTKVGGTIPSLDKAVPKLKTLDLSNSDVSGTLPASVDMFSGLEYLAVDRTKLYGIVPESLGDIRGLKNGTCTLQNAYDSVFISIVSKTCCYSNFWCPLPSNAPYCTETSSGEAIVCSVMSPPPPPPSAPSLASDTAVVVLLICAIAIPAAAWLLYTLCKRVAITSTVVVPKMTELDSAAVEHVPEEEARPTHYN